MGVTVLYIVYTLLSLNRKVPPKKSNYDTVELPCQTTLLPWQTYFYGTLPEQRSSVAVSSSEGTPNEEALEALSKERK